LSRRVAADYLELIMDWPRTKAELIDHQTALGDRAPDLWIPPEDDFPIGACFVCFQKGRWGRGRLGEPGWAAAAAWLSGRPIRSAVVRGVAGARYDAGLLALRAGPLLGAAVERLPTRTEVMLVNATGRDHPRRAGLALHLGSVLEIPTVGVTHRPLLASGTWPGERGGDTAPLSLDGDLVGYWLRTRPGRRPVAVHAAWRTDPKTAIAVIRGVVDRARTPEPLRHARRIARLARAGLLDSAGAEDQTG
jgi:deoxyribonuclease V